MMFLFLFGGICDRSVEGTHSNRLCFLLNMMWKAIRSFSASASICEANPASIAFSLCTESKQEQGASKHFGTTTLYSTLPPSTKRSKKLLSRKSFKQTYRLTHQ